MSIGIHEQLTEKVIAACMEVHSHLGPGLLEHTYEEALVRELSIRGIRYERQRVVPLVYKGATLDASYRPDLIVDDNVVVEVKAVEALLPIHHAQALTYLRVTGLATALLVNFNVAVLRDGLRRLGLTRSRSRSASP